MVDWARSSASLMAAAHEGSPAFPIPKRSGCRNGCSRRNRSFLGVEESLRHPRGTPCGLRTDRERARHVRKRVRVMQNSAGRLGAVPLWQSRSARNLHRVPPARISPPSGTGGGAAAAAPVAETSTAGEAPAQPVLVPIVQVREAVEKVGTGTLCVVTEQAGKPVYGRASTVADVLSDERVLLAKWVRRGLNWDTRQVPLAEWQERVLPALKKRLTEMKTPVLKIVSEGHRILAHVSIAQLPVRVCVDKYGTALWRPVEREVLPSDCARCALVPVCLALPTSTGVALLWRRLGLVDAAGNPTRRGQLVSFFSQGDGLAIVAALEHHDYPLEELIYDLANLDGGFRFCGEENRWGGKLANACHDLYGLQSVPGYLENGMPPKYGAGAETVVAAVHKNPAAKHAWISDLLGPGDIDRVIIEWRSMLRQIAHAPELDWERWRELQRLARTTLNETESPTLTDLPPLEYHQTRRVDHRLILRRH